MKPDPELLHPERVLYWLRLVGQRQLDF